MSGQITLVAEALRPEAELVHQARLILADAIEEHDPVAIYIALSGGNDSRCTMHVSLPVLANDPRFRGALLMDTGVGLPEAHDAVRGFAHDAGTRLTIERTKSNYEGFVMRYGFPSPPQHSMMYKRLKDTPLRAVVAREKAGLSRRARVLFVSGQRKWESARRSKLTQATRRLGGVVWTSPVFYWTTPERDAYQEANRIDRNPVGEIICGNSGDCLCGAMADPNGEKIMGSLEVWFPAMYQRLRALERRVEAAGKWAKWGHKPPSKAGAPLEHPDFFMPMCVGCESQRETAA